MNTNITLLLLSLICISALPASAADLPASLSVFPGAVQGVQLEQGGAKLAIYGSPPDKCAGVERILLTHHRRDVTWAARACLTAGALGVAPAAEQESFLSPEKHWIGFQIKRFHDYAQQSTKIHTQPVRIDRFVKEGDTIEWRGLSIRVLDTPGFTRGSVSYVVELGGKKVAFTGDLIYGDGKIFDLYSFQDAVPEAGLGGYHGYAGRLAALVESLEKLDAEKPDLVVPARGPIITTPAKSIATLIRRVQDLYASYLSTSALPWYFKNHTKQCGDRVLPPDMKVDSVPRATVEARPEWLLQFGTTSVVLSKSKNAFIFDCGYDGPIDSIKALQKAGTISKVEGIAVTHHHDDHTNKVQAAAEAFGCPIYAVPVLKDVLENPGRYRIPCMTANPMRNVQVLSEGEVLKWREYKLTFHFFPGQTYYHGATLVEAEGIAPVYMIGDAFSPAGMDDYCLLNRNLLHEDAGYPLCLKKLRALPENTWLVNQHIEPVFRFESTKIAAIEKRLRERMRTLQDLFPWDNLNYGLDERWAGFYPYATESPAGSTVTLELQLVNHSPGARTFQIRPRVKTPLKLGLHGESISLKSREEKSATIEIQIPAGTKPGLYLVTTDLSSEGMEFREWTEAMISVTAP